MPIKAKAKIKTSNAFFHPQPVYAGFCSSDDAQAFIAYMQPDCPDYKFRILFSGRAISCVCTEAM